MVRPEILYLVHRLPFPPDKGDRIRSFHILKFLAARASVHLACFADEPVSLEQIQGLMPLCERLSIISIAGIRRWLRACASLSLGGTVSEGAFHSGSLTRTVRGWAANTRYHAAIASSSSLARYLRVPELQKVPAVVDLIDVDSQKWLDYAAAGRGPRSWLYRLEARRLRRLESGIADWARALAVVSESEAQLFRGFCPTIKVHAVTNGVDLKYFQPPREPAGQDAADEACVFVGALDYYPNIDAVLWFGRNVWPRLHKARPGARFLVVGRNPDKTLFRLSRDIGGIEVIGAVKDVRPHLARAAVTVVPLRVARGVQNKVLEALATGRPTVVSSQVLAGIKARPGVELMVASAPEQWVQTILHLLDSPDERRRLSMAGRLFVERNHDWARCLQPFASLLDLPPPETPVSPPVWETSESSVLSLSG